MPELTIHTDGGSRHNPGPAASAFIIHDASGKTVHQLGTYLGVATNNQAEYQGILTAIVWLSTNISPGTHLKFYLDSLLVAQQLSGKYKIKDPQLSQLAVEISRLLTTHRFSATFTYIPRAQNSAADFLVNQTLDLHR